ncbi:MAG TPA: hypothetical protein VLG36_04665 [Candidatus Chromulinivoraceae bacterium]|nr:hypothetical protein [Candidatus Chromulinivoraceae bacterium]
MKDNLETLLKQYHHAPRRELSKTFTATIVSKLEDRPRRTLFSRSKELVTMGLLKKPAMVFSVAVACLAIGGTSYAAVGGWSGIQAFFGGEKKVDNARIVTVNTNNCTITSALTLTSYDKNKSTYYYRVINGSKLTNDQIVQIAKGYCESTAQSQATFNLMGELNKNPLNQGTVVGGYVDSTVTAISSSGIRIHSEIPMGDTIEKVDQTFPKIDPNVIVFSGSQRLTLADIHVGDHISLSYRATGDALTHSETIQPDQVNTNAQVVVSISKNTNDFTAAVNYQKYNGKEFEQVVPCSTDTSGYCNAEQYLSHKH